MRCFSRRFWWFGGTLRYSLVCRHVTLISLSARVRVSASPFPARTPVNRIRSRPNGIIFPLLCTYVVALFPNKATFWGLGVTTSKQKLWGNAIQPIKTAEHHPFAFLWLKEKLTLFIKKILLYIFLIKNMRKCSRNWKSLKVLYIRNLYTSTKSKLLRVEQRALSDSNADAWTPWRRMITRPNLESFPRNRSMGSAYQPHGFRLCVK